MKDNIFIYSRRGHEKWVNSFIENYYNLTGKKIKIFSELKTNNDYNYYNNFISNINKKNYNTKFSENDIEDIKKRCRLLRSLDDNFSRLLISSSEYSINKFINENNPSLFIAPRVDSYVLDILDRLLKEHNIEYIGLWRSAFFDHKFFITKRGEIDYQNNEIKRDDINNLITKLAQKNFTATSIKSDSNITIFKIIKKFIYLYLRDLFLELIRNLGYYKYGYREMTNRFNVKDSSPKVLSFLPPMSNLSKFNSLFESNDRKKVFIALQVNPESTIDYYSNNIDFINIDNFLKKIVNKFVSYGYLVFIKDHPNMIGRRDFKNLKKLVDKVNVFYIDYKISSNYLISKCDVIFTWSGTVAIQAIFQGKTAVSVCHPYYLRVPKFIQLESDNCIDLFLSQSFENNDNLDHYNSIIAKKIISSLFDGDVYSHNKIPKSANTCVASLVKLGII